MKIYKVNNPAEFNEIMTRLSVYDFVKVYSIETLDVKKYLNCHQVHLRPYDCNITIEVWSTGLFEYKEINIDEGMDFIYNRPNLIRTYFYYNNICEDYPVYMDERRPYKDLLRVSTGVGYKTEHHNTLSGIYSKQKHYGYWKLTSQLMPEATSYGSLFLRGAVVELDRTEVCMISGTPSIDRGGVKYIGNIIHQYFQTKENITSLNNALPYYDYNYHIVYIKDFGLVTDELLTLFERDMTNYIILEADVCRSEWLLEIECVSVKPDRFTSNT